MLVALIWFRDDFRAQGDPGSIQQAVDLRARLPRRRLPLHLDHALRRARPRLARPQLLGHRRNRLQGDDRARRPLHLRPRGLRRLLRNLADRARRRRAADLPLPGPAHLRPGRSAERRAPPPRRGDRAPVGRRHARLLRPAPRQELLLLRRRQVADRLPLRARHGDGRRRPDRPARRRGAHARRVPRLLRRARLAGRLLRRARGRRRALPRARHAHDLPRRRGDPPLRRVQPRRRRDEGGAGRGQARREGPRVRADRRDRGRPGADRRAERDQRRVARRRAGARLHDGAGRGRRGQADRLRDRDRPREAGRPGRRLPPLRPRLRRPNPATRST